MGETSILQKDLDVFKNLVSAESSGEDGLIAEKR